MTGPSEDWGKQWFGAPHLAGRGKLTARGVILQREGLEKRSWRRHRAGRGADRAGVRCSGAAFAPGQSEPGEMESRPLSLPKRRLRVSFSLVDLSL